MSRITKVYKIRNSKGEFSMGKMWPSFGKRGKIWVSLGHLKSHLKMSMSYHAKYDTSDWTIVEYEIVETEKSTVGVNKIYDEMKRRDALVKELGMEFVELLDRLEAKDEAPNYRWALVTDVSVKRYTNSPDRRLAVEDLLQIIKGLGIKKSDYRIASGRATTVAFKEKNQAVMVKLAHAGSSKFIDLVNYVETEIDETPDQLV